MLWLLAACTSTPTEPEPYRFPGLDTRPAMRGPGGPAVAFDDDQLWSNCAFMPGAPEDRGYRNSVTSWRGHLLMPWAWEGGHGGLSFWDVSDPCNPIQEHYGYEPFMRETHALGMVHLPAGQPHAGDWAVAGGLRGLIFWNMTDLDDVHAEPQFLLKDVISIDSYARIVFNVVWQYPWVFASSTDNGLIVVDATDPTAPVEVARLQVDPVLKMGGLFVHGSTGLVISAGETEAAMLDLSDPTNPSLISRFTIRDADGVAREVYSGNLIGDQAWFARKDNGAGPIVYDVSDPANPVFVADAPLDEGGGGYIFGHEGHVFVGHGDRADVYDATQLPIIELVGTGHLEGDLDTLTPFGNVAILAVDDDGIDGEESAVMPWRTEPDTRGPRVLALDPGDDAIGVASTARIGVAFDEAIEPSSVFAGSVQLHGPDGAVEGWAGGQETFAWYTPKSPLAPNTPYTFRVLAGGITDVSGNPIDADLAFGFTTGAQ